MWNRAIWLKWNIKYNIAMASVSQLVHYLRPHLKFTSLHVAGDIIEFKNYHISHAVINLLGRIDIEHGWQSERYAQRAIQPFCHRIAFIVTAAFTMNHRWKIPLNSNVPSKYRTVVCCFNLCNSDQFSFHRSWYLSEMQIKVIRINLNGNFVPLLRDIQTFLQSKWTSKHEQQNVFTSLKGCCVTV